MTWGQFIIKPRQKLHSILKRFKGHTYDGVRKINKTDGRKKKGNIPASRLTQPVTSLSPAHGYHKLRSFRGTSEKKSTDSSGKWE